MARYSNFYGWAPYVPVAERRRRAAKKVAALEKKGRAVNPVRIEGRTIARTFWGKAWCDNLESYSDYSNRLPRGRTYARNGSVIDLQIARGEINALVSGSSIYKIAIKIRALDSRHWKTVIAACAGQVDSLVEILQGKLSRGVMEVITCPKRGLFPSPGQITLSCSCPDDATMCKHVAAALYGVGARLDENPELFFQLRGVDQAELITAAGAAPVTARAPKSGKVLESKDLSGIFGIELDEKTPSGKAAAPRRKAPSAKRKTPVRRKAPRKRA